MSDDLLARIREVLDGWDDGRREDALRLEGKLAEAAADALVDAMLMLGEEGTDALAASELSAAEEELRAVATMEKEVWDGGFEQFFDSCGHDEVELSAKGCARIGAPHFVAVIQKALDAVPVVPDDEWPDDLEERLQAIDDEFFDAYQHVEELLRRRLRYAVEHPDEFRALRG
jgi:hypothetical protein